MKIRISIVILSLFLSACYYDNLDELHADKGLVSDCNDDTTAVTYTRDIKPIMLNNCGSDNSGCHQAGNLISQISLSTYNDVSAVALTGQLLGAVTHDPNYKPMPNVDDKLSDCKINKISAWINQGLVE